MIALATSLSPRIQRSVGGGPEVGYAYQHRCLESWRANGFDVFSLNAASEVEQVRALYPGVEVVVSPTDMSATSGKPLVPLSQFVDVLRERGEGFAGIVNSDVFVPDVGLDRWVAAQARYKCLFASRREVQHPFVFEGPVYRYGYDAFFFDTSVAAQMDWRPFAIGLPWWDYVVPVWFLLAGAPAARIEGLPLCHLSHATKWNERHWLDMFDAFRHRCTSGFDLMRASGVDLSVPALTSLACENDLYERYLGLLGKPEFARVDEDTARRFREAYSVSVIDFVRQRAEVVEFGGAGEDI